MPKVRIPKELQRIYKIAVKQGWTVEIRHSGHMKWESPAGAPVFTASTPSDPRGIKNHIARLKNAGLVIDA